MYSFVIEVVIISWLCSRVYVYMYMCSCMRLYNTWRWLRKGNLKRETESLPIAAKNNALMNNHIKARINKRLQNRTSRLCGDRHETINYIISKLAQKEYKTKHDWMDKVIHWELCKKFKFDHTNKWNMHNPESILEKKTHQLLWDFEIQTDHLISARRFNNQQKKNPTKTPNKQTNKQTNKQPSSPKKNFPNCGFCDWP